MGNPPTDDATAALKIQNDARAEKNLAPLSWDDNLSHQATEYAQSLANANNGLQHSSGPHDPPQGENLFMQSGGDNPATAAANSWMGEVSNYHGEKIGEGDFGSYGHYMYVVRYDEYGDGIRDGVEWVDFRGGEV